MSLETVLRGVSMVDDEGELSRLIERALSLADELKLPLVGVKLDEAAHALKASHDQPATLSQMKGLIRVLAHAGLERSRSAVNVVELHPPVSLERLMRDHHVLDSRRLSLLKLCEGAPNASEASRQLVEFAALIQSHRAVERSCVYGPLMEGHVGVDQDLGLKLGGLVDEIETDWEQYLHRWDREKIASAWLEFALATHSTLSRAGERMRLEEKVIYPLAFVSGIIQYGQLVG